METQIPIVASNMLLFWCSRSKYRFIKLDLVTEGEFYFHFSGVLGSIVNCVNINPSVSMGLKTFLV